MSANGFTAIVLTLYLDHSRSRLRRSWPRVTRTYSDVPALWTRLHPTAFETVGRNLLVAIDLWLLNSIKFRSWVTLRRRLEEPEWGLARWHVANVRFEDLRCVTAVPAIMCHVSRPCSMLHPRQSASSALCEFVGLQVLRAQRMAGLLKLRFGG
jgi:hypothetical protein